MHTQTAAELERVNGDVVKYLVFNQSGVVTQCTANDPPASFLQEDQRAIRLLKVLKVIIGARKQETITIQKETERNGM